jgi:hypothetical protein
MGLLKKIVEIDWIENFKKNYEGFEENGFLYTEMFFRNEQMKNSSEHLETIHEHRHEESKNICILKKESKNVIQQFLTYEMFVLALKYGSFIGENNIYFSVNTFYSKFRNGDNIRHLRALFVDLDIEKEGLTREEVDKALEIKIKRGIIPRYTLKIDTGRGYHLIWNIEDAPKQALPIWQKVENKLIENLKELGADRLVSDCTRVLRLTGTKNSKNGKECLLLENTQRMYLLRNLFEVYQEKEEKEKPKTANSKAFKQRKILNCLNTYSLHFARKEDLLTLCNLRKWNLTGTRELVLFLYRYWSCTFLRETELALEHTLELNKRFTKPLGEQEVISATASAEKYYNSLMENKNVKKPYINGKFIGFNPRNTTLINWLNITKEEQKELKTIIDKEEKYRRNNNRRTKSRRNEKGLTAKQQELADLKVRIVELKDQGLSIRKIAETIGKSKGSIENLLKK